MKIITIMVTALILTGCTSQTATPENQETNGFSPSYTGSGQASPPDDKDIAKVALQLTVQKSADKSDLCGIWEEDPEMFLFGLQYTAEDASHPIWKLSQNDVDQIMEVECR